MKRKKADKKKMTLMERLASMSPEEDAKKAKLINWKKKTFLKMKKKTDRALDEVTEPVN